MNINNQKTTQDSGRSMVEMLGVLAVIGVLSVGGIAGYKMAMEKYRSNQVVDMANKYAVIAYSAFMTNKIMNNGVANHNIVPAFIDTGLYTDPNGNPTNVINGTTIGNALIIDEDRVAVPLTFAEKSTCQGVANALGAVTITTSTATALASLSSIDTKTIPSTLGYIEPPSPPPSPPYNEGSLEEAPDNEDVETPVQQPLVSTCDCNSANPVATAVFKQS